MVIDWSANAVSERSALSREGEPIPAAPHPSRVSVARRVSIGVAHRSLLFAESLGELLTKEEDFRVVTVGSSAEVALRGAGRIRDGVQLIDATFVAESPSLLQAIASA